MFKKIKLTFIPSKENNFRSHLLSIKALFVYVVFLSFINLLLPNFIYGANLSNTNIYLQINKDRVAKKENNIYYSNILSSDAKNIINNMLQYQYFGKINPKKDISYYNFINSKLFTNTKIIETKNYVSPSELNNMLLTNYSSYIYSNKINNVGIAYEKGILYGNQSNIAVILFAKGPISPSDVPPVINTTGNFINYNMIIYTNIAILLLIILLLVFDVLSNYMHHKKQKMASHSHLTFTVITLLVVFTLIIGISI